MSRNLATAPSRSMTTTMPTFKVVSRDGKTHVVPITDKDTLATLKKTIRDTLAVDEEFDIKLPGPDSSISADEAKLLAHLRQGATVHVAIRGSANSERGKVGDQAANTVSSGIDETQISENQTTDEATQTNMREAIGVYSGERRVKILKNIAGGKSSQKNMVVTRVS